MKVQTSSFDQSCKHWSCNVIWKSKPDLSFSKKLSRYQNSTILLSLNVIALSNSYMYIRSLLLWQGLESFFLQHCFYYKLLIIMFIRMCDAQYWKSNNSQNGWEKTLNPGISAEGYQWKHEMQVASKKSLLEKQQYSKHLQHIAFEKDIFSELIRCIFQISLKYIELIIPKILFILVLCNFNFSSKLCDAPPTKNKFLCPPPPPHQRLL